MKEKVFILGDSYSTFRGYNPDGQAIYYPSENVDDVLKVEDTWWHQLITAEQMRLILNDSWSGSTVCMDVRPGQPPESSFLRRAYRNLSSDGNPGEKPDVILLFGGTNDSWLDKRVGTTVYRARTEDELHQVLPAFCEMMDYVTACNPRSKVICIVNTDLKPEIESGVIEAANHYGVTVCHLQEIDKQHGHPTRLGMKQIAEQVSKALR